MAEPLTPTLQPASQNPWYKLATDAGEDHAENTRRWNGYMRHSIGKEEADKLKRADGTPALPTLSPDEMGWIAIRIPCLPKKLHGVISLSDLTFAETVNFQDFYFPVFVEFAGSTFEGAANFAGSTFKENTTFFKSIFKGNATFFKSTFEGEAIFEGSTFKGLATFAGSTFKGLANFFESTFAGKANFGGSTFERAAIFEESTFAEYANFRKSTFAEYANFRGRTFKGLADFTGSSFWGPVSFAARTFKGLATFTGRTFKGEADFSNARYEGKTSFQNVTFTVAPLFFETTLHEDTDWTRIKWPDKPEDKEDATEYVRRYDRLALMMSTLKQPDNEHRFFRLSMQAKEVRDGKGISTSVSRLYGLFCYGWGLEYALKLWVFHILLGAGCLSVMALWQRSQPLPNLAKIVTKIVQALAVSFSNSHPVLGLRSGPAKSAHDSFETLSGFDILWMIQSLSGSLLLFFLVLTIRNRFRLR